MKDWTKVEKIRSYSAKDADGRVCTVDVYSQKIEVYTASGAPHWKVLQEVHKTAASGALLCLEDDGYLLEIRTGRKLLPLNS